MYMFIYSKIYTYTNNLLESENQKSLYDYVLYDSKVEVNFANELERDDRIKFYAKLPSWYKIDTPLGTYNPDWAICAHTDDGNSYFIIETKSTLDLDKLNGEERKKIECAKKHFKELGIVYDFVDKFKTFEERFLI